MKKSLYNINEEHAALIQQVAEAEGELTPELEESLNINGAQLESKSIAYLAVIRENEYLTTQLDDEIKRLQIMKKRAHTLSENLKSRLLNAVIVHGEFSTEFQKFSTRKSEAVTVENVNSLPSEYKTIKIVETANKVALKQALKAGNKIEGVELKENLNLKIN